MRNYPQVSIIFPTFNGWPDTKKCLESIDRLAYPKDKIEIIVVDNASTDGTVEKMENEKLKMKNNSVKLKIIENRVNLGFAKAVNLGIKNSFGEYLLITNNDVIFDRNYLIKLVEFLKQKPIVGIVGGKVYYRGSKNKIAFPGARFHFHTGLLRPNKHPNQIFETDWAPGCNMLIKREVLTRIGNFDEKFFFYFEDLDLCLRAKKAGYKVIYYPQAIMFHGEGASIDREGWQKKSEFYYQGKTRVLFKHGATLQIFSSLLFQFSLGLLYQLLVLKHQNYPPALKALGQNIKEFLFAPSSSSVLKTDLWKKTTVTSLKQLPRVSIIFPTLNGRRFITRLLNSLKRENYPPQKIEVIVIDNASTDGTSEIIQKNFPWVRLIKLTKNTGSAAPINLGTKIAKGEYILATNDDVIFDKNCLLELVKLALSDGRIGITTGKMMTLETPHQPYNLGFRMNPYLGYHPFDFSGRNRIRECDWAAGACLLIRKRLLEQVGGFDEGYFFCGDDYDLCFQVRAFGYKIIYNPKAIYFHNLSRAKGKGGSSQGNLFAHFRGKFRFMIKNATLLQMITFFPLQILLGPPFSYFKFGHKTFIPIIRALVWNASHLQGTLKAREESKRRLASSWSAKD